MKSNEVKFEGKRQVEFHIVCGVITWRCWLGLHNKYEYMELYSQL